MSYDESNYTVEGIVTLIKVPIASSDDFKEIDEPVVGSPNILTKSPIMSLLNSENKTTPIVSSSKFRSINKEDRYSPRSINSNSLASSFDNKIDSLNEERMMIDSDEPNSQITSSGSEEMLFYLEI